MRIERRVTIVGVGVAMSTHWFITGGSGYWNVHGDRHLKAHLTPTTTPAAESGTRPRSKPNDPAHGETDTTITTTEGEAVNATETSAELRAEAYRLIVERDRLRRAGRRVRAQRLTERIDAIDERAAHLDANGL